MYLNEQNINHLLMNKKFIQNPKEPRFTGVELKTLKQFLLKVLLV